MDMLMKNYFILKVDSINCYGKYGNIVVKSNVVCQLL